LYEFYFSLNIKTTNKKEKYCSINN